MWSSNTWPGWISRPRQPPRSLLGTKGLRNEPGENNCFLNSAVQVLWHLDVFRRSFHLLSGHVCPGSSSCIFCALKVIFTQFEFSERPVLPPVALRKALAEAFADAQRFQLRDMDDAAECFENILMRIHHHIAQEDLKSDDMCTDMCTAAHCIPHMKFTTTFVEQVVCQCKETSEPLLVNQFVYYVSASALVEHEKQSKITSKNFDLLLRLTTCDGDSIRHTCPAKCGKKVKVSRTLISLPDVVSIGLIWNSNRSSEELIKDVVKTIGVTIKLQELFHSVADSQWAHSTVFHLVGLVCYYGQHYSTFFFHQSTKKWISCDDATVREIGSGFDSVIKKCCKGHYQPSLLIYANPNYTVISTASALTKIVHVPHEIIFPKRIQAVPRSRNSGSEKNGIRLSQSQDQLMSLNVINGEDNISLLKRQSSYSRAVGEKPLVDLGEEPSSPSSWPQPTTLIPPCRGVTTLRNGGGCFKFGGVDDRTRYVSIGKNGGEKIDLLGSIWNDVGNEAWGTSGGPHGHPPCPPPKPRAVLDVATAKDLGEHGQASNGSLESSWSSLSGGSSDLDIQQNFDYRRLWNEAEECFRASKRKELNGDATTAMVSCHQGLILLKQAASDESLTEGVRRRIQARYKQEVERSRELHLTLAAGCSGPNSIDSLPQGHFSQ